MVSGNSAPRGNSVSFFQLSGARIILEPIDGLYFLNADHSFEVLAYSIRYPTGEIDAERQKRPVYYR